MADSGANATTARLGAIHPKKYQIHQHINYHNKQKGDGSNGKIFKPWNW